MGLSNKLELEEVHVPDQSMILKVENVHEDESSALDEDQPIYVLCLLLFTQLKRKKIGVEVTYSIHEFIAMAKSIPWSLMVVVAPMLC